MAGAAARRRPRRRSPTTSWISAVAALISTIVGGFGKLGLSAEDAKKFAPVMFEFLRTKVSPEVASKLEKTLRS